ncbi:MAG: hypothetical protein IH589_08400 [Anaerolineales bacterium]|nr:hypothetical protein [Anaerolineales bacterium]
MLNEPRTYRHSPFQLVLLFLIFGVLAVGLFVTWDGDYTLMLPIAAIFGLVFVFSLYSLTIKTTISDDEISTQSILGTKSLKWTEINRVSGRGHAIKLHNMDGDVTVAPSPQLAGYAEVVEWIGGKRPDLFSPQEYSEMTKNWYGYILLAVVALFIMGIGFFFATQSSEGFVPLIFFLIIAAFIAYVTFSLPKSLNLEGNTLFIRYFFNEKSLRANEITAVSLNYTQTRNGKNYFVRIDLKDKKYIRISGVGPNLPIVFLVLRNWHRKHAMIGQTIR